METIERYAQKQFDGYAKRSARRLDGPLPAGSDDPYSGRGAHQKGVVFGALLELTFSVLIFEPSLPPWMVCALRWLPWAFFAPHGLALSVWVFSRLPLWGERVCRAAYSVCRLFCFGALVGAMLVAAAAAGGLRLPPRLWYGLGLWVVVFGFWGPALWWSVEWMASIEKPEVEKDKVKRGRKRRGVREIVRQVRQLH